jgi:hypothetical protein
MLNISALYFVQSRLHLQLPVHYRLLNSPNIITQNMANTVFVEIMENI